MTDRKKHSPLGASGAERWMHCPGSVELIKHLSLPESDEPDYRVNGTAAHALGAECLTHNKDTWEYVGQTIEGVVVDVEMADAVQIYLDTVRPIIAKGDQSGHVRVEFPVSSPVHPDFYGTADLFVIYQTPKHHKHTVLDLTDYKHGEGIMVEVEENPQLMYYAFGVLEEYPETEDVILRIVQPRGFHPDGPVREWHTTATHIREFVYGKLVPAMERTQVDDGLDPGAWCRFCPAKLVCPMLTALYGAAMKADPRHLPNLSDEMLGENYRHLQGVKFYIKALEEEAYRRLNMGTEVPHAKLVHKKANRVFRSGADKVFPQQLGAEAFTKPQLKGPAEMEKVSAAAKALVKEWAYTPESGLTVALADDLRPAVIVRTLSETYAHAVDKDEIVDATFPKDSGERLTDTFQDAMFPGTRMAKEDDGLDIPDFMKRN